MKTDFYTPTPNAYHYLTLSIPSHQQQNELDVAHIHLDRCKIPTNLC